MQRYTEGLGLENLIEGNNQVPICLFFRPLSRKYSSGRWLTFSQVEFKGFGWRIYQNAVPMALTKLGVDFKATEMSCRWHFFQFTTARYCESSLAWLPFTINQKPQRGGISVETRNEKKKNAVGMA